MSADDEIRFRPKLGRVRSDAPKLGNAKSFLTQAKKMARQQSNCPSRSSSPSSSGSRSKPSATGGKTARASGGPGLKRGRGAAFVRSRTLSGGWRHSAPGMRRVVVKTRYVQNAGKNGSRSSYITPPSLRKGNAVQAASVVMAVKVEDDEVDPFDEVRQIDVKVVKEASKAVKVASKKVKRSMGLAMSLID